VGYVVLFSTFLLGCVDYQQLFVYRDMERAVSLSFLSDIHWYLALSLSVFCLFWLWHFVHLFLQVKPLSRMHHFYTNILLIPDRDLETIQWSDVVKKIVDVFKVSHDASFKLDQYC